MTDASRPDEPIAPRRRRSLVARALRLVGTLALVAGAGVAAAGLGAALHSRAAPGPADAALEAGIPVVAQRVVMQDAYRVETRHLGTVEAARSGALAFELSGIVAEVMVEEGDRVAAGQSLARLDAERLSARLGELDAEAASLAAQRELARRTLERQSALNARGHAAEQRLDEAALEADRLAAAEARVLAAREGLEIELRKTVLRAPWAGEIAARHLDEGAVVSPGAPALELVEASRPQVRLGLPAVLAAGRAPGDRLTVLARGRAYTAEIVALRPDLDPATRTRAALLDLIVPEGERLAFGETVEALIEVTREERGAWLPLAALREGERGLWTVLGVEEGPDGLIARPESVEVLHLAGERAFVRGSVADGDRVIVAGPHRLVPGDRVVPQAPGAGRDPADPRDGVALAN